MVSFALLRAPYFSLLRAPDASQGSKPEPPDPRPVSEQVLATVRLMFKPRMVLL